MYKAGDRVRVWSLQSFHGGGFLKGEEAIVRQDQIGSSVILIVPRNIGGEYKIDESYEVYAEQCKPMGYRESCESTLEALRRQLSDVYKRIRQGA